MTKYDLTVEILIASADVPSTSREFERIAILDTSQLLGIG